MVVGKKWVMNTQILGEVKEEQFTLEDDVISHCPDEGIIAEAKYLSVDPYMRYRIRNEGKVGHTVTAFGVGVVLESKNASYPVGSKVIGDFGWRTHASVSKEKLGSLFGFKLLPDLGSHPLSAGLGVLGMPGNTAYFGFLEICDPKKGETVLVNGAAGAVGSAVCQIAKLKGCTVIAFAGSDEKVNYLKELGIDFVFNYKTTNITDAIKSSAPNGINCFFDNVGGKFTCEVLHQMAPLGRISACGAISTYNDEDKSKNKFNMNSPYNEGLLIMRQLKVQGFMVPHWGDRWMEGITQMKKWVDEGSIKYKECVTNGFENMPKAFIGLFTGANLGKAVVKC